MVKRKGVRKLGRREDVGGFSTVSPGKLSDLTAFLNIGAHPGVAPRVGALSRDPIGDGKGGPAVGGDALVP